MVNAASSSGRALSGGTKLNTISLDGPVARTMSKVSSSASSVRYWLTPSMEKNADAVGSSAASGKAAFTVVFSKSTGANVTFSGIAIWASAKRFGEAILGISAAQQVVS